MPGRFEPRASSRCITSVEVRADEQLAYSQRYIVQMMRTVWSTGGCTSWNQGADGVASTDWPTATLAHRRAIRRFDPEPYELRAAGPVAGVGPASRAPHGATRAASTSTSQPR